MRATDIAEQLEALAECVDDFGPRAYELTDAWSAAGAGLEAVEPVLRFMENHPSIDFGSPGPLVHFVERFDGPAYVDALVASIRRRPTAHTAWMLNRTINGAENHEARRALVETMKQAREHPLADEAAVAELTDFLEHQSKAVG